MREIKFRAWDGKNKRMVYEIKPFLEANTNILDLKNFKEYDGGYIFEQFTGLNDCDGKEIYEGDIVEVIMPCGTPNEITDTVQYNDVYGCFFLRTRYTSMCDLIQSDYNFKIIGNSHEAKQ